MITELLKHTDNEAVIILAIIALFLVVVGAALYLTPRLARWLDKRDKTHPGYFDGMLEEDPGAKKPAEEEKEEDHV